MQGISHRHGLMSDEEVRVKLRQRFSLPEWMVTDERVYRQRRAFLRRMVLAGLLPAAAMSARGNLRDELTPESVVTSYNNFYEFGYNKDEPARKAAGFRTRPWQVRVSGLCEKSGLFDLDDLLRGLAVEERIYRFRCVEAWSMVIPWMGVPLGALLKRFRPLASARYVRFTTLFDPERMPGQRRKVLDWPYVEGLRMDEAMHPLTLMATGLYGKPLPPQNGAPLRLVVPWKYGFKSIKSIVQIHFQQDMPMNTWRKMAPDEYGFYANVNPVVDHPRWSQATERIIGKGFSLFGNRRDTEPFNGYADQVAGLYRGMDLRRWF